MKLEGLPDIRSESLKALGTLRRKPRGEIEIPQLSLELESLRADPAQLAAYRDICGFADSGRGFAQGGGLPIAFPQVQAAALQMHLLTQPQFPLPLLGLVHLRNVITQHQPLNAQESYRVQIATAQSRRTDKGLEFDLVTVFSDAAGAEAWRAVATVLYRGKGSGGGGTRKPPPETAVQITEYLSFDAPADIGRRYGKISGDMNPIHLYPLTAKLFGFPRHIAHGMWTLARCAALLEPRLGKPPRELSVQFRQPLFLPGRVALRFQPGAAGIEFALVGRDSGKSHLAGRVSS